MLLMAFEKLEDISILATVKTQLLKDVSRTRKTEMKSDRQCIIEHCCMFYGTRRVALNRYTCHATPRMIGIRVNESFISYQEMQNICSIVQCSNPEYRSFGTSNIDLHHGGQENKHELSLKQEILDVQLNQQHS